MGAFLAAFKTALHAKGMTLSIAFVPNDVKQSCTSYGNGVWDLTELGKNVDLAMLEDYAATLGTPAASCPATFTDPSGCYTGTVFGPFVDEVDLLCVSMLPSRLNITMNAWSLMTNPFAGEAMSLLESYRVRSVGLFPQINSDGAGGTYAIYESNGMTPSGTTRFTLLAKFQGRRPAEPGVSSQLDATCGRSLGRSMQKTNTRLATCLSALSPPPLASTTQPFDFEGTARGPGRCGRCSAGGTAQKEIVGLARSRPPHSSSTSIETRCSLAEALSCTRLPGFVNLKAFWRRFAMAAAMSWRST